MAGTWWEKEVALLDKRFRGKVPERPVLFETGYGPSGLPHLGTFAEVARTAFVCHAYTQAHPDVPVRLVAFSDDMDGLRSVPENLPQKEMLAQHLAKPLCKIPDPFGQAESFSDYMISKLREFVAEMGVEAEFMSSSECYSSGRFDEGLVKLLENDERVKSIVLPTLKPETRKSWSPFLPICEACGRYTTVVTEIHPEAGELSYACNTVFGGAEPCGHSARTPVTGGRVKVGWKVDWALRWYVLGVDYEMYGKDLIESATLSGKIVRVLGASPPAGTFYEMFLDEDGHKISKKIGNGVSLDEWRTYAPGDSILLYLTKPPRKARRIGLPMLPQTVDDLLDKLHAGDDAAMAVIEATTNSVARNHGWAWESGFSYSLLISLVGALGVHDAEAAFNFLQTTPSVQLKDTDIDFARQLIDLALAYDRDVMEPQRQAQGELVLEDGQQAALEALAAQLVEFPFDDAQALQNLTYEIGKANELHLRTWFGVLYRVLTGAPTGPRLGTLLLLLGRENSLAKLSDYR
jgi:lysyl-tRNA synthetase class 1